MTRQGVAVLTGASAGVGRATARALAGAGFDVGLLARGEAGLEQAARDVQTAGRRALAVPTDVADWGAVDAAASRVEAELGPISVWVNDAMTTVFAWSWDCHPDEIRRATEVTYLGQVNGTLAALARMRPRDQGRIVNVGSALAFVGIPLQSAYCGAKFACRGFTESVRAELLASGSGVTIGMVHLPAVNTPQFDWCLTRLPRHPQPVPPIYEPEVAAAAIVEAALDGRSSKVLGAWNKLVVAGTRVAPSAVVHYAARTGVESQQTDAPVDRRRPSDLWAPADAEADHGARGGFSDRAGGTADARFLRTVPSAIATFTRAVADAAREWVQHRSWHARSGRVRSASVSSTSP